MPYIEVTATKKKSTDMRELTVFLKGELEKSKSVLAKEIGAIHWANDAPEILDKPGELTLRRSYKKS